MTEVWVLRIGHRLVRDERMTTHVALVARAFGARGVVLVGDGVEVKRTIDKLSANWGGHFSVSFEEGWVGTLQKWKAMGGIVVHLSMYGLPVDDILEEIRSSNSDILVVVGAEKVPRELYSMSHYNVAIGSQPHSEVAALAVFLDHFFRGEELKRNFHGSKLRIIPSGRGKDVETIRP